MGGRRIDDHSNWTGAKPKDSVFAAGAKMMSISEVEGAGHLNRYEDNEKEIADMQRESVRKAERHDQREGYRY